MIRVRRCMSVAIAAGLVVLAGSAEAARSSKPKEIVVVGSKVKESQGKKAGPGLVQKRSKRSGASVPATPLLFQENNLGGTNPVVQGAGGGSARRR